MRRKAAGQRIGRSAIQGTTSAPGTRLRSAFLILFGISHDLESGKDAHWSLDEQVAPCSDMPRALSCGA
jgi:hypothetical protein